MTRKEEYAQYLLTDVWQAKKVSALKRAGNKCEKCERAYKLHVHHRKYPKEFGGEPITWLRVLCIECHANVHAVELLNDPNAPPEMLLYLRVKGLEDLIMRFDAFPRQKHANERYRCGNCGLVHSPNFACVKQQPEVRRDCEVTTMPTLTIK